MLTCVDAPAPGLTTYSTVSLHLSPNLLDDQDIRTELAGVVESGVTGYPDAMSTAAFYVMKDHWLAAPGVVFEGIFLDYELGTEMEHLMWAPPFEWDSLKSITIGELNVHWLLAIPIYESERRYLVKHGYFKFEDLLERNDIPYFDLSRPAVA